MCIQFSRCGRRGRENLREMKTGDFAVTQDAQGDLYVYNVKDELTKNHQNDSSSMRHRMWEIKGICHVF